ncbi:MAG: AI-2E family transporter [Acidobacteria bacterium]|nr:AI-2E family transporter [Acidobacteriota bacterium]
MKREYSHLFFVACFIVILYFFYGVLSPFVTSMAWAAILSTACHPVYVGIRRRLKNRASLSAAITCALVVMIIVIPMLLTLVGITRQAIEAYRFIETNIRSAAWDRYLVLDESHLTSIFGGWLGRIIDVRHLDMKKEVLSWVEKGGTFLVTHSSGLLTGITSTLFSFFLTVIMMYFLFMEGDRWIHDLRALSPLPEAYEELLIRQFKEVSSATLYGSVLTAMAHGVVGGVVFAILQVPATLLLAALMAFLSIIPVVGAFIVWLPAGMLYIATGHMTKGVGLLALGILIVTVIDNIIRPLLIKGKTNLHPLLVFLSVLGGIKLFGFLGLVLGPLIASLFITFLHMYKIEFRDELAAKRRTLS